VDQKNFIRAYSIGGIITLIAFVAAANGNIQKPTVQTSKTAIARYVQPEFHYGTTKIARFQH
jgi:predicted benzoate:H+ symporter BenE